MCGLPDPPHYMLRNVRAKSAGYICEKKSKKLFFSQNDFFFCLKNPYSFSFTVVKVQQYQSLVVDDTLLEWWAFLSNCFDFIAACSLRNYSSPHYCTITMGLG